MNIVRNNNLFPIYMKFLKHKKIYKFQKKYRDKQLVFTNDLLHLNKFKQSFLLPLESSFMISNNEAIEYVKFSIKQLSAEMHRFITKYYGENIITYEIIYYIINDCLYKYNDCGIMIIYSNIIKSINKLMKTKIKNFITVEFAFYN